MPESNTVSPKPETVPSETVRRLSPIDKWVNSHAEIRFRESRERAIRGLHLEASESDKPGPAATPSGR